MNQLKTLIFLILLAAISTATLAREPYKCQKIRYSNFKPKHKAEAIPGSVFSFTASKQALPNTIRVKVKKTPVDVKVEKKGEFYKVTGRLPADMKNTFARISILGNAVMECETKGGWLVNITGAAGTEKPADNDQIESAVEKIKTSAEAVVDKVVN